MGKEKEATSFKIAQINKFTCGKIGKFTIPDSEDVGALNREIHDAFLSEEGDFIGDFKLGLAYLTNNMVVCLTNPVGVGVVLNKQITNEKFIKDYKETKELEDADIKGYFGYSNNGGQLFTLGNRIFDAEYIPVREDYDENEWLTFEYMRIVAASNMVREKRITGDEALEQITITSVIPFEMRGKEVIKFWSDAKRAAINLSEYLNKDF